MTSKAIAKAPPFLRYGRQAEKVLQPKRCQPLLGGIPVETTKLLAGLVHSLADFDAFRSAVPELLSPSELRRRPSDARRFAGTEDDVFFYVGPPMRVPEGGRERPGVIIFRADIETSDMVATPWDSGGLHRRRAQHLSDVQRKALLDSRTMPAPDYRRALAATLLLRFNGAPESYLRGHIAQPTDPDNVYDKDQCEGSVGPEPDVSRAGLAGGLKHQGGRRAGVIVAP